MDAVALVQRLDARNLVEEEWNESHIVLLRQFRVDAVEGDGVIAHVDEVDVGHDLLEVGTGRRRAGRGRFLSRKLMH